MSANQKQNAGLVPRLRFPEFRGAGEWEEKTLGSLLDYQQPTDYLVSDTNYNDAYKTPVLTAGKTFILGYTNEPHGIFNEGLPVIIFDDFTTATQFVDFPFKAKSSAMKILQARGKASIKFMYEALQMASYEVGAHERHWISKFAPMLILVPHPDEQQKIADCLTSLDDLIRLEAEKLDALKTHKKGLMQQLFPAEGETLPKLRFPEFREVGEWKYLELNSYLQGYAERVSSNTDLPIYSSTRTGLKLQKDYFNDREVENDGQYGVVPEGYFVYRHMSDDGTFKFNLNKTGGKIAVSKEYPVFTTVGLHSEFLLHSLNDGEDFKAFAFAQKKGGTRTRLYLKVLRTCKALLPSYSEQQKIADCLSALDTQITTQAEKIESLKTHKKALMQQLFPSLGGVAGEA